MKDFIEDVNAKTGLECQYCCRYRVRAIFTTLHNTYLKMIRPQECNIACKMSSLMCVICFYVPKGILKDNGHWEALTKNNLVLDGDLIQKVNF